ncbi:MAG: leucine-rich repeat domain-containing protein [Faecalibacterium prausnitzii]
MKQRFSKRTRLVSALLTLAMVFTFLPFSAFAATDSYGPVYITDANVPDKTFREYLLKQFDKDGNGVLTPAERYAVTEIDVENKYISNLSGIEFFPNLKVLNCGHNRLTKLDVSKNTVLQELVCWENQLTSLDVSQNTALQELACFENQLTSLDVSQNPALQKLSCWDNRLTSLDVSKNTELTYLDCGYNRLTELDVSQNTKLTELYFVSNKITSLQADNCTNLTVIFTGSNKYKVEVYRTTRILDPSILPGNFDISRVRNLKGATQNADGTLTVQEGGGKVTYEYRCVGEIYKPFTLNVTETDDPNAGIVPPVTPPSGGDTPGGSTGGETGGGSTGGSTPGGPTGGETGGGSPGGGSTGGGDGGGAVVIVAAAGAVAAGVVGYGVYNYVSGRKLQALLPEGVAAPENRAQTALLLWNTAGRPEPADAPAFADVADPDTAKAAQWCVEQGLMKRRLNGKFAPGSSIPAYQVLNAYRKLAG